MKFFTSLDPNDNYIKYIAGEIINLNKNKKIFNKGKYINKDEPNNVILDNEGNECYVERAGAFIVLTPYLHALYKIIQTKLSFTIKKMCKKYNVQLYKFKFDLTNALIEYKSIIEDIKITVCNVNKNIYDDMWNEQEILICNLNIFDYDFFKGDIGKLHSLFSIFVDVEDISNMKMNDTLLDVSSLDFAKISNKNKFFEILFLYKEMPLIYLYIHFINYLNKTGLNKTIMQYSNFYCYIKDIYNIKVQYSLTINKINRKIYLGKEQIKDFNTCIMCNILLFDECYKIGDSLYCPVCIHYFELPKNKIIYRVKVEKTLNDILQKMCATEEQKFIVINLKNYNFYNSEYYMTSINGIDVIEINNIIVVNHLNDYYIIKDSIKPEKKIFVYIDSKII